MHLQQLKGMQRSKQGISRGYHLSIEGVRKGYLFREKGLGVGPRDRASLCRHLLSTPPRISTQSFMLLAKHVVRSVYLYSALAQLLSTIRIRPM